MPLDSVTISALVRELNETAAGTRIDKIQQPEGDELLFSVRRNGFAGKLLISAGTGDARVHFTDAPFENPAQPPMFCMLLRKHLTGARITGITQPGLERMADISMDAVDQLGDICPRHLIVEMMGRYSNIILTDEEGRIIDCLRRVDSEMSEKRQVLPGLFYRLPPPQDKRDPFAVSAEKLAELLQNAPGDRPLDKWLLDTFAGFSPLMCRELAFRACGQTDLAVSGLLSLSLAKHLSSELSALGDRYRENSFEPFLLSDHDGRPADFSCLPIAQYGSALRGESFGSFSQLLDAFYSRRSHLQRMKQRSASLMKTVRNARDRASRKLAVQISELDGTKNRERLREFGDIITANLHTMKKGMEKLTAVDFYSENGEMCEIPLDIRKTPQQNAAKYYKDYTKARNAERFLTEQIENGRAELEYLNSVIDETERAESETDLSEIRRELTDAGYIKPEKNARKSKPIKSQPMRFVSSAGFEIRVGRSNVQNDQLTLKDARRNDIWLHAQKIHGSHVIISTNDEKVDEKTLYEAACLAAWFSQGRDGGKIPVDYTQVRYVKKPAGAKPGMVIYTDYKTVYVASDASIPDRLHGK